MKKATLYLILSVCSLVSFGQSITTNSPNLPLNGVCTGKTVDVPFTTTGKFGAENQFRVQMIYEKYENTNLKKYTLTLDGNGTTSPVRVTIPDTIRNVGYFKFKVISTEPMVEGFATGISFALFYPLAASLTNPNPVNPNDLVSIGGQSSGQTPGKLYLSDSSIIELPQYSNTFYFQRRVSKTTTFSVLKTENACGVSVPNSIPSATVVVNPIGFKLIKTEVLSPCAGGSVFITYDSEKPFNADNTFKAIVEYTENQEYPARKVELPCSPVNKNTVSFRIPDFMNKPYSSIQSVSLVSSSPEAIALNREFNTYVGLTNMTELSIKENKIGINWGEEGEIVVVKNENTDFQGDLIVTDGKKIIYTFTPYWYYTNAVSIKVKPDVTTTYQVYVKVNGCERLSKSIGNVEVKVNPGIKATSASAIVCENGKGQIQFTKKGNFNADNVFNIEFWINNSQKVLLPATVLNDSTAEFTLAQNYFPNDFSYENENATIRIRTSSPFSVSDALKISIKKKPSVTIPEYTRYNTYVRDQGGSSIYIDKNVSGGQPYKYLVNDGNSDFISTELVFTLAQSGIFSIKQISNACGTTTYNDLSLNVTIKNRVLQAFQPYVENSRSQQACQGSTIEVPFAVTGQTDSTDVYHFEINVIENNQSIWKSIGSGKKSPIKVTLPANLKSQYYSYRINNPTRKISWSDNNYLNVIALPSAKIPDDQAYEQIITGTEGSVYYVFEGGGNITVELSNGQKQTLFNRYNGDGNTFRLLMNQSETYTLKSVQNECGVGTVSGKKVFDVKDFKIATQWLANVNHTNCEGNTIGLAKSVNGNLPQDAKFKVQMSDSEGKNFGDIESVQTGDEIYAIIPTGFRDNNYTSRKFQIVCTNYEGIYIPSINIGIFSKPTARISGEKGESVLEQVDTQAKLKIEFTGSGAYYFSVNPPFERPLYGSDDYFTWGGTSNNPYIGTIIPKSKNEVYELTSLSNSCGYGTYSGSVRIGSVKPTLTMVKANTESFCAGKEIEVTFKSTGDFNADNVFKIELNSFSGKIYEILQTKNAGGVVKAKIPEGIVTGQYTISVRSTSPVLSSGLSGYSATTPVNVELFGSTIINQGERAYLTLKGTKGAPFSYTLSDGTIGIIQSSNQTDMATIQLTPKVTTEYRIVSVNNGCGEGQFRGSAKVIVNPLRANNVIVSGIEGVNSGSVCTGKKVRVLYSTTGNFSSSNKFILQASDENGENFKEIPSTGTSPLVANVPDYMKVGLSYRFRVVATDTNASCSASTFMYRIYKGSTGQLLTNNLTVSPDQAIEVKFAFKGELFADKYFSFGTDSLTAREYYATDSLYTLRLQGVKAAQVYKLFYVYDYYCDYGQILGNNRLVIDLLTAQENPQAELVVYPNPTSNIIQVQNLGGLSSKISVTNVAGKQSLAPIEVSEGKSSYEIDIQQLPSGTYLLIIEQKNKTFVNKIIKL